MIPGIYTDGISSHDLGLVLNSYQMSPPNVKTRYVDLPLGNGSIDLTEAILGDVSYSDRKGEFNFTLLCPVEERADRIAGINAFLHGKRRKLTIYDDPIHYYLCRLFVSDYTTKGPIAALKVEAIAQPYRYLLDKTVYQGPIAAGASKVIDCRNSRMRVIPTITLDAAANIAFGGSTYSLSAGAWTLTNIVFDEGPNPLTITAGAAPVAYKIEYQEGVI